MKNTIKTKTPFSLPARRSLGVVGSLSKGVLVAVLAITSVQINADFLGIGKFVKKHPGETVGIAIGGALLTDSALGKLREKRQQEAGAGQYIDVGKRYAFMSDSEQKKARRKSIELYQKGKSYKRRLAEKLGIMSY